MMLIKLFLFFLLLLILPDMYIYKAYIRRVSQKWTHWAYWLPSLFLLLGMTLWNILFLFFPSLDCIRSRILLPEIM